MTQLPEPKPYPNPEPALSRILLADDGLTPSPLAVAGFALIGAALAILVETLLT